MKLAEPSPAATIAGSTKMPAPIIMLIRLNDKPQTPMDLSSLEAAIEVLDHKNPKQMNHEGLEKIHA